MVRHAVAKGSTTAQRRADQRRKAQPQPVVVCPCCGRAAMAFNARERAHVCLFLGCRGRVVE